ncbi:MAG TPA: TOBE domain-containing protein [Kiloniellaceae bacterium]|nr:TOBE domain-containing protein [Kiloniellaceae bacterium]
MKLSARNLIKGTITDITKGAVAAEVQLDIGGGNSITSTVTVSSVERLGLEVGQDIYAVIKASEVILAVD